MPIDLAQKYIVHGQHTVLGLFRDLTQQDTHHEYLVVWENFTTGAVFSTRVDNLGRAFGQGKILSAIRFAGSTEEDDSYAYGI